jgi:hypothetical protein
LLVAQEAVVLNLLAQLLQLVAVVVFLLTETKAIKAVVLEAVALVSVLLLAVLQHQVKVMLVEMRFTLHLTMVAVVVAVLAE